MAALLKLTALSKENQQQDLSFLVDDLEAGLDSLNRLIELGEHLVRIRLIHEMAVFSYPPKFSMELLSGTPIHQLRETWEQLLAQPEAGPTIVSWRQREVIEPFMAIRTKRIDLLQDSLNRMLYLQKSAQKQLREGPKKTHLLIHYQGIIDRYNRSLAKVTAKQYF